MTSGKTESTSEDLRAIAQDEATRRKTLHEAALAMFKPVIDIVQTARQHGTNFSLTLRPPATGTDTVKGAIWWRAFHPYPDDDHSYYDIVITPKHGSCWIGTRVVTSEDDRVYYSYYEDEPEPEWCETYYEKSYPSLGKLRDLLREALISELAEKQGGPSTFKV